jgi:hypothetical protein
MFRTFTQSPPAGVFLAGVLLGLSSFPGPAWSVNPITGGSDRLEGSPIIAMSPASAEATLIDFESIPVFTDVNVGGDIVPVAGSVLTTEFAIDGVVFGKAGVSAGVANVRDSLAPSSGLNSVQGLNAAGIIPGAGGGAGLGDIFFSFVEPGTLTPTTVDMVSFTIGDAGGDLDIFEIRSYDLADMLIDTQNVQGNSRFSVTINVPGIHRIEVDFTGEFGYSLDDLMFNLAPVVVLASLDIKPTSCPNPLNPRSQGRLPVAILGTADFDVTDIDVSTILLEGVAPVRFAYEDVAAPVVDGEACECDTLGADGFMDLTLKFRTQDIVAALGPVAVGDVIELTLTGELNDGTLFEATDCVIIRGGPDGLTFEAVNGAEDDESDEGRQVTGPISPTNKDEKSTVPSTWSGVKSRFGDSK